MDGLDELVLIFFSVSLFTLVSFAIWSELSSIAFSLRVLANRPYSGEKSPIISL